MNSLACRSRAVGPCRATSKSTHELSYSHLANIGTHKLCTKSRRAGRTGVPCKFRGIDAPDVQMAGPRSTAIGKTLTKPEQAALQKYATSISANDDLPDLLYRIATEKPEDLLLAEGAVLQAEQQAVRGAHRFPGLDAPDSVLSGTWHFIFTTAGGFPRSQYLPINEYYRVDMATGQGAIIGEFGSVLTMTFTGKCSLMNDTPQAASSSKSSTAAGGAGGADVQWPKLKFAVEDVHLKGRWLDLRLPFKFSNSMTFYWMDDRVACSRTDLGVTLMIRVAGP